MESNEEKLNAIAQNLDISPTDFKRATERFSAVKEWLLNGSYRSGAIPNIYLQGSFRLGTVVRPYKHDKDGDFDIDQVCELTVRSNNDEPETLKHDIGDRLKDSRTYGPMLDDEGKRCWTLIYASDDNRPGFHIDVLPALTSQPVDQYQIDITDKDQSRGFYSWSYSNPNGYYHWFRGINNFSDEFKERQRNRIFLENSGLYSQPNEVPTQLYRSSLQRSIQIMKRHRDVHFSNKEFKPISIIITTIVGHLYRQEGIFITIQSFVLYVMNRHSEAIKYGSLERDNILDYRDGNWVVPNPVHHARLDHEIENFADKWEIEPRLASSFFDWVYQLDRDLGGFNLSGISDDLSLKTTRFGKGATFPTLVKSEVKENFENGREHTDTLLDWIHLGIEGKADWGEIKALANEACLIEGAQDVAKVNFYQIALHSGMHLSEGAKDDVKDILSRHLTDDAFIMCCNILLDTVTPFMIRNCIKNSVYSQPLKWPIMRLVKREYILPS